MTTFSITLNSFDKVQEFVKLVTAFPFEMDLKSGRYVVDAKSIMGIYALDLSKPIEIDIHSDDCDALVEALKPYMA